MKGKRISAPGTGPCNEHNYTSGLLLYYYVSGCERAKAAVLGLADWVIAMDDGRRNLLGIASHQPTGAASRTFSDNYHGPGRGAGNSINALMDAWQLSGEERFQIKAQEIIRRCCHPHDHLAARDLGNAEVRWSYTVFLQSLGRFLELTYDRKELRALHAYVRASVLHYARWMAEHERFYLDEPEKLEYPTETWAAQELRKGAVLLMAARYTKPDEAERFRNRGREILDRAWQSLLSFPTRACTRPLALVLQQGYIETYLTDSVMVTLGSDACDDNAFGLPYDFVSQKNDIRRAVRSPRAFCRLLSNACRPAAWWNAWKQTWIAESLRWH
jgi:hypothetical protein